MTTPCEGIRVLDFGRSYGAIPGMILADYGADVVKVEPPEGDFARSVPGFLQWNRGKRGIAVNLRDLDQRDAVRNLAVCADVIIENFRPGVAYRLGLSWDQLADDNPGLVHLSISGFDAHGPTASIPGYEGVVAAKCGQFVIQNGYRAVGPIFDAVPKCSFGASMLGLVGVLAALAVREATGVGQHVETSLFQANFVYSYTGIVGDTPEMTERLAHQVQGRDPHNEMPGYRIAQCSDGKWIQSGSASGRIFENLMRALEIDDYFTDPRFAAGVGALSPKANTDLLMLIDRAYQKRPLEEWCGILDQHDAAYGVFMTTQEFMDHPQVVHNGHVVDVDDPGIGRTKQIGPLARFERMDWRWPGPAPVLGEDNAFLGTGWSRRTPRQAKRQPLPSGALDGVTIIDLSMFAAAPGGPGLLADLGARVIKIEPPTGDPLGAGPLGGNELFFRVNRGKERIAVDLKLPEGKRILHSLVAGADVVVHNFRPGVPERLGADSATLHAINSRLVYVYASSFGSTGPYSHRPAFDAVISAMAGGEVLQAGEGNPPQQRQTTDHSALLGVAAAILLGLRQRNATGEGQSIETTMLATAAYLFSDDFIRYEGKPARPQPDRHQLGLSALYRLYRTSEDGWVFLACPQEREWQLLCPALDMPDWLADPRFATAGLRRTNDAALAEQLEERFGSQSAQEWERALLDEGVPCVVADETWPSFLFGQGDGGRRQLTIEYQLPVAGTVRQCGRTIDLTKTPGVVGVPEQFGSSTRPVLQQLGYSTAEIDELERSGVIAGRSAS